MTPQHDVTPHDHDDIISQIFQIHPLSVPSSPPIVEPSQTTWAPRDRSWSLTVHSQDPALSFDQKTWKEKEEGSIGGSSHVLKGLDFQFAHNDGQDPSRLLIGRWLKYETKQGAKARSTEGGEAAKDESDYVTLVRYSASFPRGRATALMNWRLGAIEVDPLESSVLVMSISRAIFLSVEAAWGDSEEGVGSEGEIPSALKFLEGDEWGEWSVLTCYSFICLYAYTLVHLFAYSLIRLFAYSLIRLFAYLLICLFTYSLICLYACSLIRFFVYVQNGLSF